MLRGFRKPDADHDQPSCQIDGSERPVDPFARGNIYGGVEGINMAICRQTDDPADPPDCIAGRSVQQTWPGAVQHTSGPSQPRVFARIITPTAGLRLAGIRPGQVLTPSQLAAVQNIIQVNQGQLTLDPNQIHQITAGGAQKQNVELKIEPTNEIKNEPK